jgi:5-methyltetrahydrofolate--homocysteine methyltransferase
LKLAPHYPSGVVVQTSDASTIVPVAAALVGPGKDAFIASHLAEQQRLRQEHAEKDVPLLPLQEARARALSPDWCNSPQPRPLRTGIFTAAVPSGCPCCHKKTDFAVSWAQLEEMAEWGILLRYFEMQDVWNPARRTFHESAPADKLAEAQKLLADARELLSQAEAHLQVRAVFGIWPAARVQDDVLLENGTLLHTLRQQKYSGERPCLALADFVAPQGMDGYVGAMQLSVTGGDAWAADFEAAGDSYHALLCAAMCSMLAEAMAECTQECVESVWPVAGSCLIRPACGYPSQPDHREKEIVFNLLNATEYTGAALTESAMMQPVASICALLFNHPEARYFAVGPLGDDQRADYEQRTGHRLV